MDCRDRLSISAILGAGAIIASAFVPSTASAQTCGECDAYLNGFGYVLHAFKHEGPLHTCCPTSCHSWEACWCCGYYHM
jgi:hypothetical protein